MKPTKIAVVDDHRIFLDGISLLLAEGLDFQVESYHAPVELLQKLELGERFNLILCDLIMADMNGLAFIAAVRAHSKAIPILMLSGINTTPPVADIKRLGGNGFVHKSADPKKLLEAINGVLSGGDYFPDQSNSASGTLKPASDPDDFYNESLGHTNLPELGPRQLQVLKLIAHGATNKEIAQDLNISQNTVKSHLKQIFIELGVNKRTACVRKAQTMGLI